MLDKIVFNEDPAFANLGTWDFTALNLLPQNLRIYPKKFGSLIQIHRLHVAPSR